MKELSLTLEKMYHPDGKSLGSLFAGLSGSGKTTMCISTLQQAVKSKSFGEFHRFIIIDPKCQYGDYDLLADPLRDMKKIEKSILKERVTVVWPDLEWLEDDVSHIVDFLFHVADTEPKTTFTVILDEASILITPTKIPLSLKRLSVQGRAKRIKPIFLSQRPIVNRWTDANLSNLILFNTLPVDFDTLSKRWGVDFVKNGESLREVPYSYIWFNMEKATFQKMNPVDLPKPRPKKKKGRFARLFNL